MSRTKVVVSSKAYEKAISEASLRVKRELAKDLGQSIVDKMLDMISKGYSTIQGNGRFPAYKANEKGKKKYPDTVRAKFPNKRRRPVNLELSGDFLKSLKWRVRNVADKFTVQVGFFNRLSILKEQGHREQANGQAYRPIIPTRDETLDKRIFLEAVRVIRQSVVKHLGRL